MPLQLCSHSLAVEWIHFPRIRTFVENCFHGLFSKKKRSKSGCVPSFPRREHVLALISFLSQKISPEKSLDFWSQKLVLRPALHPNMVLSHGSKRLHLKMCDINNGNFTD